MNISPTPAVAANHTRDITNAFIRATEQIAFPDFPAVLGTIKDNHRDVYHADLVNPGDRVVRYLFIKADKALGIPSSSHPTVIHVDQARPDCDCPHYQARAFNDDGTWNGNVCKHIVARLNAVLSNPANNTLAAVQRVDWVNLLHQLWPLVDLRELDATVVKQYQGFLAFYH